MQPLFNCEDIVHHMIPTVAGVFLVTLTSVAIAQDRPMSDDPVSIVIATPDFSGTKLDGWAKLRLAATSLVKPSAVAQMEYASVAEVPHSNGILEKETLASFKNLNAHFALMSDAGDFYQLDVSTCQNEQQCMLTDWEKDPTYSVVAVTDTRGALADYNGQDFLITNQNFRN